MKPAPFKEQNYTFKDSKYEDLPAFISDREVISMWRMTWRERLHCLFRGYLWVSVADIAPAPIYITAEKSIFVEEGGK